jgi:hypothetical protein
MFVVATDVAAPGAGLSMQRRTREETYKRL